MTARSPWLRSLALLPGGLLALLPAAKCPVCISVYAGLLSPLGLGFLSDDGVLSPLIAVLLAIGVLSIGWSTRTHRRWGPLLITAAGSLAVVAGRLVWSLPLVVYGGIGLLASAALWNLWLKRPRTQSLVQVRIARKEGTSS